MIQQKYRIFSRTNVLTVMYLLALWFSASAFFQFDTVVVLEDNFPGDPDAWLHNGVTENLRVSADSVSVLPRVRQRIRVAKLYDLEPADGQDRFIRVTAKLTSEPSGATLPDAKDANNNEESLFYAWFEDAEKNRVKVSLFADLLETGRDLHSDQVIVSPDNAISLNVGLLLRKFQAQHSLVGLNVSVLERTFAYKIARGLLILLPLVGLFFALRRVRVHQSVVPISLTMVLLVALSLIVGVLLPGNTLRVILGAVLEWLPFSVLNSQAYSLSDIQDVLHFLGFIVLSLVVLAWCAFTKYSRANAILKLILFAMFTEIIQRHSVERSPSFLDVFIDSAGVFTGVIFWLGLCWFFTRWRKPRELA